MKIDSFLKITYNYKFYFYWCKKSAKELLISNYSKYNLIVLSVQNEILKASIS